jgi:hypothetical protein
METSARYDGESIVRREILDPANNTESFERTGRIRFTTSSRTRFAF